MAGLAAAGAAAGTAIMPGIGTAVGGVVGALADTFMGGGGDAVQAAPGGPRSAANAVYGSGNLNADAWSVNFSGTQTNTPRIDKQFSATGPTASTAADGGGILPAGGGGMFAGDTVPPWALLALAALLVWKFVK